MTDKYTGKNLLVLGSNIGASDIVKYVQQHGGKAFVADWYLPEKSYAKQCADENAFISTADIDELVNYVEDKHIDGVLAGIQEFNLLNAMELSKRCDLPFYCTKAQWDAVENKAQFRALCEQHHVPCPRIYYAGDGIDDIEYSAISYPVVLKPADANSSRGVFFCYSKEELQARIPISREESSCGRIIIEELCQGYEFTAHYVIAGGRAKLCCIDNRYPVAVHEGAVTTIPIARVYPSLFLEDYEREVDPSVIELCENLGLQDAILFVQGLHDSSSGRFCIFEGGLRSAAESPFRFIERVNGTNYMQVLIDHALFGRTDYDLSREDPYLAGQCCAVVSCVGRTGIVARVTGFDEAQKLPSVIDAECRYPEGTTIPDGDTLRQLALRFVMCCESREKLAEDIAMINSLVDVQDENGVSLLIKMDPERVLGLV